MRVQSAATEQLSAEPLGPIDPLDSEKCEVIKPRAHGFTRPWDFSVSGS